VSNLISVIVPAYNADATLPACLQALQEQTLIPTEVIVVDDGSTDGTASVARAAGVRLVQQPRQGPAAARNAGIAQAQGDLLLFTDADCIPAPAWVAEMTRPFADPLVAGVKGSYRTLQPQPIARLVQCEFEERYDLQASQASIDLVDSYSAAYRADVLRRQGAFNPAFSIANEDVELSYRLSRAGLRLLFNRQAIVYHRHPSSWADYMRRKIQRGYWRMLVYRLYPAKAVHDSYTPQNLKLQVGFMGLFLSAGIFAIFFHWLALVSLLALIGLALTSISFLRLVRRLEPGLLVQAGLFIFLRALAFVLGVSGGLLAIIFTRPSNSARTQPGIVRHV